MYYASVEELSPAVSQELEKVTIVGMKYYEGNQAFDRITESSQRPVEDQLLFLVQDVHNKFDKNAVMLHDGSRKLGHVVQAEAIAIRALLDRVGSERGQDQVIIVTLPKILNKDAFKWSSSFNVKGIGMVYERIARKHAQNINAQ